MLAADTTFTSLVGSSSNKRMDFEELILRFFALVDGLETYKPALRQFLNEYMRAHRNQAPDERLIALFRACCQAVNEVLGSSPFKLEQSRNFVNKAMFDAIMVPLAFANLDEFRAHANDVRTIVDALPSDDDFRTSIGRATADRRRMLFRVGLVADRLRKAGVSVDLAEGLGLPDSDEPSV